MIPPPPLTPPITIQKGSNLCHLDGCSALGTYTCRATTLIYDKIDLDANKECLKNINSQSGSKQDKKQNMHIYASLNETFALLVSKE